MAATNDEIMAKLNEIAALLKPNGTRAPAPAFSPSTGGALFPNYGRSKGKPIAGASIGDLKFYRDGCLKSLANPEKARWHDKERALLETIEAEMRFRGEPADDEVSRVPDTVPANADEECPF